MKQLKEELESICLINEWNPTSSQLEAIRTEIEFLIGKGQVLYKADLNELISKHCPEVIIDSSEGADNSYLNALLTIAINESK